MVIEDTLLAEGPAWLLSWLIALVIVVWLILRLMRVELALESWLLMFVKLLVSADSCWLAALRDWIMELHSWPLLPCPIVVTVVVTWVLVLLDDPTPELPKLIPPMFIPLPEMPPVTPEIAAAA